MSKPAQSSANALPSKKMQYANIGAIIVFLPLIFAITLFYVQDQIKHKSDTLNELASPIIAQMNLNALQEMRCGGGKYSTCYITKDDGKEVVLNLEQLPFFAGMIKLPDAPSYFQFNKTGVYLISLRPLESLDKSKVESDFNSLAMNLADLLVKQEAYDKVASAYKKNNVASWKSGL